MVGANGKKRFTIYIPGIGQVKFGTCEERDDDRRDIQEIDGEFYLVHYPQSSYDEPAIARYKLPPNTLVANGYYAEEHLSTGGFSAVKDFVFK